MTTQQTITIHRALGHHYSRENGLLEPHPRFCGVDSKHVHQIQSVLWTAPHPRPINPSHRLTLVNNFPQSTAADLLRGSEPWNGLALRVYDYRHDDGHDITLEGIPLEALSGHSLVIQTYCKENQSFHTDTRPIVIINPDPGSTVHSAHSPMYGHHHLRENHGHSELDLRLQGVERRLGMRQ